MLLGNSGVGKSSLAQAGVLAALIRQAWPGRRKNAGAWPPAFSESRRWCFLKLQPGTEPMRALVEPFIRHVAVRSDRPAPRNAAERMDRGLVESANTLRGLLDATEGRFRSWGEPKPLGLLPLYRPGRGALRARRGRSAAVSRELLAEALCDHACT